MFDKKEYAVEQGYSSEFIDKFENFKQSILHLKNDEVAEMEMVYFLENILWSNKIELAAKIIKDYGMEFRLKQWLEAIEKIK